MENSIKKCQLSMAWITGSGVASLIGSIFAVITFPDAKFGINPTGQFGWHLVGFAFSIGLPLSIVQWCVLRQVPVDRDSIDTLLLYLWIPITSIAVTGMILPLWWVDAEVLFIVPWTVVYPMIPGMVALGFFQWGILHQVFGARFRWVPLTIMGAAIGAMVGLIAAFIFHPIPLECTWATLAGISIASVQAATLARDVNASLRRHN